MSVILTQYQSAPKTRKGKMKKCNESARPKMSTKVAEPKNAKKRSTCFKSFSSETLHAVLAVTSCSDLVACQITSSGVFSSLVSSFPWQIQHVLLKPVFGKCHLFRKKKKNRKERFKKQNPRGWYPISDGEEERSYQLRTFAMEMTYVLKLRLVTLTCFTAHTRRHIFLQGLVLSCQSLCERRCPSSIGNQKKKDVRRRHDLIADIGNERQNSVQVLSLKCAW